MSFAAIKGQKRASEMLKAAFTSGRLSHAYLFYGPAGVGKRKMAQAFTQLLNCETPLDGQPCRSCKACRKVLTGNHPDVTEVRPDGASLKIAQIRELQDRAHLMCYEGNYKVIMIDDAHLMTAEAANSLLKILEEPPGQTVFILLTSDTKSLPDTILSRCQGIPFQPLDDTVISEILQEMGVTASFPLALAHGSVGKALELAERIDNQRLQKELDNLLADLQDGSYRDLLAWAERMDENRELQEVMLSLLASHYRDRLIRQMELINFNKTRLAFEALSQAEYHLKYNANIRLSLEVLLLRLRSIEREERGTNPIG